MRAVLLIGVLAASATATAAPVRTFMSDPHAGIHRETWVDMAIPAKLYSIRIDLTSQEIVIDATKESDRGITTSEYSDRINAQVAINGGPFTVANFTPRGLAMGDLAHWASTADDTSTAVLHFRRVGERTFVNIIPTGPVTQISDLPSTTQGVVSGRPLLVRAGAVETNLLCSDQVSIPCTRAPRSAAALSLDGNTLWLVTVDGWQTGSSGMNVQELGSFLLSQGAHMAMNLDVGSTATMVVDGTRISKPSDTIERAVANHIGVKFDSLTKGQLVGFVCKANIFDCDTAAKRINGATVKLDDGRVRTTPTSPGPDGFYSFTAVTPRFACITAKADGYKTNTACKKVNEGPNSTFNSIALVPGVDLPDAGVPEDADIPEDDASTTDGGPRTDGPGISNPDPVGCCNTGSSHPPIWLLVLVVVVAFRVVRRRGTKA